MDTGKGQLLPGSRKGRVRIMSLHGRTGPSGVAQVQSLAGSIVTLVEAHTFQAMPPSPPCPTPATPFLLT